MAVKKSEHAKKKILFCQGKIDYFTKQAEKWQAKHIIALKEEAELLSGKIEGQLEIKYK